MFRIARAPPVAGLALAAGAGAALVHQGVPPAWGLLSLTLLLLPIPASPRSTSASLPLILAFLAGGFLTHAWALERARDCRYHLEEGAPLRVAGRVVGRVTQDRGELRPERGGPGPCTLPIRFVLTSRASRGASPPDRGGDAAPRAIPPGARVLLQGRWLQSPRGGEVDPLRAGYLRVDAITFLAGEVSPGRLPDVRSMAGAFQTRLGDLFPREAGLVEALVLARKEGLAPSTRESFARAGTAHLLAISGFHVGVVAGLLLLAGGGLGLSHPLRLLAGSGGVWGYVLFIGLPDAALRAALILTVLSLGRLWRRAVAPAGALATTFLLFLLLDPGAFLRPGFQLSFAGALGLVLWARPLSRRLSEVGGLRVPTFLSTGVGAGVAATLATLPLVAWHFGRVALVGIPVTLLAAPLVTLAIPGIFLSLMVSFVSPGIGAFLARGVEADLWAFRLLVEWAGALPFASVWVSRPAMVAGAVGGMGAHLLLTLRPSLRRYGRRTLLGVGVAAGILVWPLTDGAVGAGVLEMVVLDVGQGDAILLRSPRGRWILVDAGPRTESYDAGARAVLPYLRRRGGRALDLLVLTHPDMDHVGGAGTILREFPVARVLDPGMAVGSEAFLEALEGARESGVPWTVATAGDSLELDGVALRVLWPDRELRRPKEGEVSESGGDPREGEGDRLLAEDGANALSLVLELRFGAFSALLTGDAPSGVEARALSRLLSSRVQVLKLGHHGSRTSTSPELLERADAEAALVSVGARNRYGHPHGEVLQRLHEAGVEVHRTDRDGTLTLRAHRDGRFEVRGTRSRP